MHGDLEVVTVTLTRRQAALLEEAGTNLIVEWRQEVDKRYKKGQTMGALEDNLGCLTDAREALRQVLKRFGYMR